MGLPLKLVTAQERKIFAVCVEWIGGCFTLTDPDLNGVGFFFL